MRGKATDLTGRRFGILTVIRFDESSYGKGRRWFCRCDCGAEKSVSANNLMKGNTVSCGCMRGKASKHGDCKNNESAPLYRLWSHIKDRCYNPHKDGYHRYGGRGIKMCDEWLHNYEAFKKWAIENGYKRGLQIDRKDNGGNYEPGNCHFVTGVVNTRNQDQVKLSVPDVLSIKALLREGVMPPKEIAAVYSVSAATVRAIRRGDRWADVC